MGTINKGWGRIPLDRLVKADWNYKLDDPVIAEKLAANIKRNGQIENILVRLLDTGFYEIVNGNHRYDAMVMLEMPEAMCFNLGTISDAQARRIAVETNETRFSSDLGMLGIVLSEIVEEFTPEELLTTMPYTMPEMTDLIKIGEDPGPVEPLDSFGGSGDSEFVTIKVCLPQETLVVWNEARDRVVAALKEDGRSLHGTEAVANGQLVEILCAEYLAGSLS